MLYFLALRHSPFDLVRIGTAKAGLNFKQLP